MRILRLLLIALAGLAIVVGILVAVAFNSRFQTWAARQALAARPELGLTIGTVSAGLHRVHLQDLRIERPGVLFTAPAVEVDLPVLAAGMGGAVEVRRLVAHGWTLDLSKTSDAPGAARAVDGPGRPKAGAVGAGPELFAGVFPQLTLPRELALDAVELDGSVVLPAGRGRTKVRVTGGGFRVGAEGRLEVALEVALADPRVSHVEVKGTIAGRMTTRQAFEQLRVAFDATARGTQFPSGVGLKGEVTATRTATGEQYGVTLATPTDEILQVGAELPTGTGHLLGSWKLNMRDGDVAPFAFGGKLPKFDATGEGRFDWNLGSAGVEASGRLAATIAGLEAIAPELAALPAVQVRGDFDLAERGGAYAVRKLGVTLATPAPVLTVTALQPFEFNPGSGALRPTDAARELVGIAVHGLPLAWAKPWLGQAALTGGNLRGEFTALPRGGGVLLRSTAPVTIDGVAVSWGDRRLIEQVDVSLETAVDYNPRGWQAEIGRLAVRRDGTTMLTLAAKAGQLKESQAPLKTTGRLTTKLALALAQPGAAGLVGLTAGDATVEFAASLGAIKELHAKVDLENLHGPGESKSAGLPALSADIRADIAADGKVGFNVPLTIAAGGRMSDATIAGTLVPGKETFGRIEAAVSATQVVIEDVRLLAAALSPVARPPAAGAAPPPAAPPGPPWAGIDGTITLQLGQVIYSELLRASQVSGRIRLESGKVKMEDVQAGLGERGRVNLTGALTFEGQRPRPYALDAAVALKEFDPGPLFQSASSDRPAIVEGNFDLSSTISSRAETIDTLVNAISGEFQLSSRGGVFRGLPASVHQATASTGRVAGLIAAAGSALGGLTGRKEPAAIASRAQAVAELTAGLNAINFDQLSVVLSRDAALNTTLRDFALIAPELRLTGGGTLLHRPGASLLEDSCAMEFGLRARGRQGDLLRHLGVLDSVTDDLGYAACSMPVRVGGTLGRPDASDLSTRLAALALEKSGVTEKAGELFNRIIGGGK